MMRFVLGLLGIALAAIITFFGVLFGLWAQAEGAGGPCMPLPVMMQGLLQGGEHVIVEAENMILTRSHEGVWTVLELHKGVACIILSGSSSTVNKGV